MAYILGMHLQRTCAQYLNSALTMLLCTGRLNLKFSAILCVICAVGLPVQQ